MHGDSSQKAHAPQTIMLVGLLVLTPSIIGGKAEFHQFSSPDSQTLVRYFTDNYDMIVADLAHDRGDYLDSLSSVFGCKKRTQRYFSKTLAKNIGGPKVAHLKTPALPTAIYSRP